MFVGFKNTTTNNKKCFPDIPESIFYMQSV